MIHVRSPSGVIRDMCEPRDVATPRVGVVLVNGFVIEFGAVERLVLEEREVVEVIYSAECDE